MAEFLAALTLTLIALPLVRIVLVSRGVLDVPNARSSHAVAIARGGGIACAAGMAGGLVVAQVRGNQVPWALLAVVAVLALLGLADDLHDGLPPVTRLVLQAAAGAATGWMAGSSPIAAVCGAVVMVLAVNVVNFMDGINGITGLTVAVWGVSAAVVGRQVGSGSLEVLGLVATGAALAFLPFNLPAARLFLGDCGSYLFGATIATGCWIAWRDGALLAAVVAPMTLYLVDVLTTLVRRAVRREPLMQAHRDHIYQRVLLLTGWPHWVVAGCAAAGAAAITLAWYGPTALAVAVTIVVAGLYVASPRLVAGRRPVGWLGSSS
ncbi:hypothetical protein ACPPVT_02765 [Angustibacter sp. McL0619]|uniref:hypothetical protein n=1 Tax=Angustibacter sp. McL0619 TaxID=3415676 RepID=UPI003CEB2796